MTPVRPKPNNSEPKPPISAPAETPNKTTGDYGRRNELVNIGTNNQIISNNPCNRGSDRPVRPKPSPDAALNSVGR